METFFEKNKKFSRSAKHDFSILVVKKTFDTQSAIPLDQEIFLGKMFEQTVGTDAMADKLGTGQFFIISCFSPLR